MLRPIVVILSVAVSAMLVGAVDASAAPSKVFCTKVKDAGAAGSTVGGWGVRKCKKKRPASHDSSSTATPTPQPTPKPKKPCLRIVTDPFGTRCHPKPTAQRPSEDQLQQVVAKLKLPDATPRFGPDPSANEWNMLVVGYPIWLWTDGPTSLSTTAHSDGLDFTLAATWQSTTFTMGDGHTKTCAATTAYPAHPDHLGEPSPTCGYTYDTASAKAKPYTVSAEASWRIDWSSGGEQGSFVHTYTASRSLDVGELGSMIRG
jgi:hypothetical protein